MFSTNPTFLVFFWGSSRGGPSWTSPSAPRGRLCCRQRVLGWDSIIWQQYIYIYTFYTPSFGVVQNIWKMKVKPEKRWIDFLFGASINHQKKVKNLGCFLNHWNIHLKGHQLGGFRHQRMRRQRDFATQYGNNREYMGISRMGPLLGVN